MSLPIFMQKGLTALLQAVKLTDPAALNEAATTLEQHFTLSTREIAAAYQRSYESALKAIIAGLGQTSLLNAKVIKEFAEQVESNYLPSFAAKQGLQGEALSVFCTETIKQCQTLSGSEILLFSGEKNTLNREELVALISDNEALSITELVLKELSLNESLRNFLCYNDLLGSAILFFLEEEFRKNERFQATLSALQAQDLRQDNREIKELLKQVMNQADLSPQIKPRDEFSHHNSESRRLIENALTKLKRLPANNHEYSQLMIMSASVLSSAGALAEAEKYLIEAMDISKTEADRGLAAFNLFQVRLRNGDFDTALSDLKTAIQIDPRYKLHDVDKYPIERILGVGGMGVVFLCRHQLQKQQQVVKCFWESCQGQAKTVFKEAFMMSDIAGEFVPKPIDYGYVDPIKQERAFFVTEYIDDAIDGETWLAQQKPLNLSEGLQVGLQIAMALQAAHKKSILHLDLKPANILLKHTQTGIAVKIIDFGLAKVATSLRQEAVKQQRSQTQLSVLGKNVFGTLDYACPEQQGFEEYGKPAVQCDVFAFGKTLYRLLSGKQPRHNLRQRDLPNVPALYELLEDCVEEEPKNRPKSVLELIKRLTKIKDALGTAPQVEDKKERQAKEVARHKQLAEEQRRQEKVAKQQHIEVKKAKNAANDTKKQLQFMLEQKQQAERKAEAERKLQAELEEAERKRQEKLEEAERKRQEELEKEDKQAWELACQVDSIEAYQTYFKGNTLKKYANEAQNMIHTIEDKQAWESADKVGSIDAYQAYLNNGNTVNKFAINAKKRIQILKEAKNIRRLSASNPIDYFRVLWWSLITPAKVIAYEEEKFDDMILSKFKALFIMFIHFSLLLPSFALGLELLPNSAQTWSPEAYLWIIAGLVFTLFMASLSDIGIVLMIGIMILAIIAIFTADLVIGVAVSMGFIWFIIIGIYDNLGAIIFPKSVLLLIVYNIFLIYYCFFDGWRLFV